MITDDAVLVEWLGDRNLRMWWSSTVTEVGILFNVHSASAEIERERERERSVCWRHPSNSIQQRYWGCTFSL